MYRDDITTAINALENKYLVDAVTEVRQGHFSKQEGIKHIRKAFSQFKKAVNTIFFGPESPLATYEKEFLEKTLSDKYKKLNRAIKEEKQLRLVPMDDGEPLPPFTFDFQVMDFVDSSASPIPQTIQEN